MKYKNTSEWGREKAAKYADGGEVRVAGQFDSLSRYGRPPVDWSKDPNRQIKSSVKPFVTPEEQENFDKGIWTSDKVRNS